MSRREPALDERVVELVEAFTEAGLPFAIGGAIALAYYAEPRATVDIDLNVFIRVERAGEVLDVVRPLGVEDTSSDRRALGTDGQARLRWGKYKLDVFLSNHPFHDSVATRVRMVPFSATEIPILACEDLVVFKVTFNRPKDWLDIEQVFFAQAGVIDLGYLEFWIEELFDKENPRRARFREALENASGTT
jgi:hypothetical protein